MVDVWLLNGFQWSWGYPQELDGDYFMENPNLKWTITPSVEPTEPGVGIDVPMFHITQRFKIQSYVCFGDAKPIPNVLGTCTKPRRFTTSNSVVNHHDIY